MKVIENNFFPFKGFAYMVFFGYILKRRGTHDISKRSMNHEEIHEAQAMDFNYLGIKFIAWVLFYFMYILNWIFSFFSYDKISFEREAYANQSDFNYLESRKRYSWFKYLFRK